MIMLSRRITTAVSLVVAAIVALGAGASPALAGEAHPFLREFGHNATEAFSNPNGIAVEESTGDVYVADIGTDTVYKFDAQGNPVNFSALGSNALTGPPGGSFAFPAERGNLAAIAVDNSTSPSAGDLYVMDAGHRAIDKFSSSGTYISQISGPLSGAELLGLGVEANGDVARIRLCRRGAADDRSVRQLHGKCFCHEPRSDKEFLGRRSFPPGYGFAVSPAGDMYLLESAVALRRRRRHGTARPG